MRVSAIIIMSKKIKGKQIQPDFIDPVTCPSVEATVKYFRIPHPSKKGYALVHAAIEGPENAVYLRGKTKDLIIELPEYFQALVDVTTITVHLTPIGGWYPLFVREIKNYAVIVGMAEYHPNVEFSYLIQGTRTDIAPLVIEQPERESESESYLLGKDSE